MIPVARKVWQPIWVAIPAALCPPVDHREGITAIQGTLQRTPIFGERRPKKRLLFVLSDPSRSNVLVKVFLEGVVHRHLVVFATLCATPPAPILRKNCRYTNLS